MLIWLGLGLGPGWTFSGATAAVIPTIVGGSGSQAEGSLLGTNTMLPMVPLFSSVMLLALNQMELVGVAQIAPLIPLPPLRPDNRY